MSDPKNKNRQLLNEADASFTSTYYDGLNFSEDCSNSWSHYLQMLNGVCAAGARVAASLRGLSCKLGTNLSSKDFPGPKEWETMTNAMLEATLAAHSQTTPAIKSLNSPMQEHHIMDQSYQKKVIENIISVINIQYRFCITSCRQLNIIAENKHNKYKNDIYDDVANIYPQIHNLNIPSSQSDDTSTQNSFLSLYSLKNDPLQIFHNSTKPSVERNPINSIAKDSHMLFYRKHSKDTYACNHGDDKNNELYQLEQDNTTLSSILQKCSLYNESKFPQQSSNSQIQHFANFTSNAKPQNPTAKFKELRNTKQDTTWWNSQTPCSTQSVAPTNPPVCFELPSASGVNKHIQSAQLRRWSEAAAHAANGRNDDSGNVRRWSVPWDGGQPILTENTNHWNDKYNPRDKSGIEGQDSLDTAILLLSFRSHKGVKNSEQLPKRQCSSENQSSVRPYSIWSGSGTLPFLQLSESLEQ